MSNVVEKIDVNERIYAFIQKYRRHIITGAAVIFAALAVFIISLTLVNTVRKNAISRAEELNRRYEVLRFSIADESKKEDIQTLLDDCTAFAEKTSGIAGARVWSIIAGIRADKKEWDEAEHAWNSAAKAGAKTYLAPVSLFNAAAAAEEGGNSEKAIELYTQCVAEGAGFPSIARAQFSIGRLYEAQKNKDAALEAYRKVVDNYSKDTVWSNLAQSRIINLQAVQ
jgi:tetratricopeptide (TPR) repeat protein